MIYGPPKTHSWTPKAFTEPGYQPLIYKNRLGQINK